jgi:hypothetical protein
MYSEKHSHKVTIEELCDNYLPYLIDKGFIIKRSDDRLLIFKNNMVRFCVKEVEDDLIPFLYILNKLEMIFYNRLFFSNYILSSEIGGRLLSIEEINNNVASKATCDCISISIK